MGGAACREGQLLRGGQIARQPGVHQELADPGGAQQPPGHLPRAQLAPPGEVVGGRAVRFEAQQRRTPAAHREPELAVEEGGAERGGRVGFGQERLEHGRAQLGADHPMAVVVHQGGGGSVGSVCSAASIGQYRPGSRRRSPAGTTSEQGGLRPAHRGDRLEERIAQRLAQHRRVLEVLQRRQQRGGQPPLAPLDRGVPGDGWRQGEPGVSSPPRPAAMTAPATR